MKILNDQNEILMMSDSIADRLSHWTFDDQKDDSGEKCNVSNGDFSANFDIVSWNSGYSVTIEVPPSTLKVLFELSEGTTTQVFGKSFAVLGTSAKKEEQRWHVCLYLEDN